MKFFYIFEIYFFLKISQQKIYENKTNECDLWEKKHLFNNTEIHMTNATLLVIFDTFDDFTNKHCQQNANHYNTTVVKFYARKKINFENGIGLRQMIESSNVEIDSFRMVVVIQNINGFNLNLENLSQNNDIVLENLVYLNDINFDFYINNSLITREMCDFVNFKETEETIFGNIRFLHFNDDIFYRKNICPFIFNNTHLIGLSLSKITNSLIFKNQIEFLDINKKTDELYLNVNINYITLGFFNEQVSSKILSRHIFKNAVFLSIIGSINSIQEGLFSSFKKIRFLNFQLDDLKYFFQTGIEWMKYLNEDLNVNIENNLEFRLNFKRTIYQQFSENQSPFRKNYEYPSQDMCLFKDFPHRQLVYPLINPSKRIECSCTILWLIKYFKYYYRSDTFNFKNNFYGEHSNDVNLTMQHCLIETSIECNFTEMFKLCVNISSHIGESKGVLYDYFILEWIKYIINVYFQTFFAIVGFFFNLMIVFVAKNIKIKNDSCNSIYKHIKMNAIFNTLFCLVKSFSLINICIFPRTSFCSSIYKYESSQYFRIVVGLYLGNVLKICCNFSYIFFVLKRFSASSANQSKFFAFINHSNIKKSYFLILLLSLSFSSFKIFEYKPNEIFAYFDRNFPYNVFDTKYCLYNLELSKFDVFKCSLFPILNLINNIFNNVFFVIICVIVDILLIRFTKEALKKKLTMIVDERNRKEAIDQRDKITKMVIINGTIYFISHVPEFVITIVLIVCKQRLAEFSFYYISFTELMDISESFVLISISSQFFIFKKFDQNFQKSFKDRKRLLRKL